LENFPKIDSIFGEKVAFFEASLLINQAFFEQNPNYGSKFWEIA